MKKQIVTLFTIFGFALIGTGVYAQQGQSAQGYFEDAPQTAVEEATNETAIAAPTSVEAAEVLAPQLTKADVKKAIRSLSKEDRKALKQTLRANMSMMEMEAKMAPNGEKKVKNKSFHWANFAALGSAVLMFLSLLFAVPAIIFGIVGMSNSGPNKEFGGYGMGLTGLILGSLGVLIIILAVAVIASWSSGF